MVAFIYFSANFDVSQLLLFTMTTKLVSMKQSLSIWLDAARPKTLPLRWCLY